MMRALILAAALTLLPLSSVNAATTITLNQSAPAYQTTVNFTVTGLAKKYACTGKAGCARIEVLCYQDVLVYGEAGAYTDSFLLGGGGSIWVNDRPDTPASCVANLFRFDDSGPTQTYVLIASTSFEAAE